MEGQSKPILGYWKVRGLAAPIIYLLKHIGVDYELKEYEVKVMPDGTFSTEEWTSIKATMPLDFPNLPYFIDGEVKLTENFAIYEYICAKWNPDLLGKDLEARGLVNMLAGVFAPLRKGVGMPCYVSSDRKPILQHIKANLPTFYTYLGNSSFLTGSSVAWIDFAFYELVLAMTYIQPNLFAEYPLLEAYTNRVAELPGLKEYLADKDNCQKTR
jgi:glutathione S-transferase